MAWIKPRRMLKAPDARLAAIDGQQATLEIEGLFCKVCANRVTNSLNQLDAVESATCDLESATASVQLKSDVSEEELRAAVIRAAAAMPARRAAERVATALGL